MVPVLLPSAFAHNGAVSRTTERFMQILIRLIVAVGLAVALLATGGWLWLHESLPKLEGELAVKGLAAPVDVVRDSEGVPHLYAKNARDGWVAMGCVHAQDRLWQMEFQRRVASGTLSEILGERAYDTDRLMRTLGFAHLAEAIVARLDAPTRSVLEAYAEGVNACAAAVPVLPPEFHVMRTSFAAWKPAHTVGWLLVMAWDLSGNWRTELNRLRLSAKLGRERVNEIIPPYPGDPVIPIPDFKALYAEALPAADGLLALSPGPGEAVGSNSWALSGTRTASGKPLLANDPHLGLQAPALWYFAHLSTPEGNLVGGTLPGVPFVVLGRNDHVAWTMTTTNGDTQDLYIERVAPGDPASYLAPKGPAKFAVREEVIRVGNEERRIRVRSTRHGPVISDAVRSAGAAAPPGHVIALAWSALSEGNATVRAGLAMNRARNAAEFVAAARDFHAPQQNLVYADVHGRIGMIAPALIPKRRPDNPAQGRVPVPGWDARYDWQGFLAFEELPAVADPKSGTIVTANHKTTPPGYKPFITWDWFGPWRAERIEAQLAREAKHTERTTARLQADALSRLAVELLPVARAARPDTDEGRAALALVAKWSGEMVVGEAAPLVFSAWYRELSRLVYADELGDLFSDYWEMRGPFMVGVLKNERGLGKWCDNVASGPVETCAEQSSHAFDLAAAELLRRYGEPAKWRWGEAHRAHGVHRPLGFVPYAGWLLNVSPPTSGDTYTVNVGHFHLRDKDQPFANRHAPSLRAIYDLADLDRSLFMHSTGQSGNILSPWYSSYAERWARVEYFTIPTKREAIAGGKVLRLVAAAAPR
jgi:penicillin amidase